MRRSVAFLLVLILCLGVFSGCGCKHEWEEATCEKAETCSLCGEIQGEPLGHAPGAWIETEDAIAAQVHRENLCARCGEVTDRRVGPMTSMVRAGLFLFAPEQFLQRLTAIARQLGTDVAFEPAKGEGLVYSGMTGESQVLIQFFPQDNKPLTPEMTEVWCVSYTGLGQMDAAFRQAFYMACDPALSSDTVFNLDMELTVLAMDAVSRQELFGYHLQNGLLYETLYFPENTLLEGEAALMVNVYASDFR